MQWVGRGGGKRSQTVPISLITSCMTSDNYLISLSLSCIIYKMKILVIILNIVRIKRKNMCEAPSWVSRMLSNFKVCYITGIQSNLFQTSILLLQVPSS